MPKESEFRFIWKLSLSKYNTRRYEDKNIAKWKNENFGEYVRNDRFVCASVPDEIIVSIRKDYHINVKKLVENCPKQQGNFFVQFDEKYFSKRY